MILKGHTIEDIKKRVQIIRDFYRELKEKSISNAGAAPCLPLHTASAGHLQMPFSHFAHAK